MSKTTVFLAFVVVGAVGCSKEGGSSGSAAASAQPAAAATGGAAAKPTESDFCGLKFPPGAEVQDASAAGGGELQVKLVSNDGFNKIESFFGNQLYGSTDQTMSNKDELRTKTWDKPSPDGKCKLKVDIKGDPTPKKVNISIVKKAG